MCDVHGAIIRIFSTKGKDAMSRIVHVLSVVQLSEEQLQKLRAVSPLLSVEQHTGRPEDMLTSDTEVLYMVNGAFDLKQAPHLRWIQLESGGVEQLHNTPVWQSDVTVTTANGVHAVQIAEHVMMSLLALGHRLPLAQRLQAKSDWQRDPFTPTPFMPLELRNATLGIIGYGAIGREVARLATAFGMRVLATKRAGRPAAFDGWTPTGTGDLDGTLPARYYTLDELPEMLPACDAVVLALPIAAQTKHLFGKAELALLPSHAFLVNVGRGGVLDHDALIATLQEGRLGGAALDVTDPEPLPAESPLWQMENVIITPHISGMSSHYNDRAVELFAENLRRYLRHESLLNEVQRKLGY
jgi:Phosphoglycerate dehydrogenase and related dehydrogenases